MESSPPLDPLFPRTLDVELLAWCGLCQLLEQTKDPALTKTLHTAPPEWQVFWDALHEGHPLPEREPLQMLGEWATRLDRVRQEMSVDPPCELLGRMDIRRVLRLACWACQAIRPPGTTGFQVAIYGVPPTPTPVPHQRALLSAWFSGRSEASWGRRHDTPGIDTWNWLPDLSPQWFSRVRLA